MRDAFAFLPRGFSSLADYISPAAFDVVDWKGALKRSARITKEIVLGSSVARIEKDLASVLPHGLVFARQVGTPEMDVSVSGAEAEAGQRVLELYFNQLRRSGAVFLDLRAERFHEHETGCLLWKPNGLWTEFAPAFTWALIDLYRGFYDDDRALLTDALGRLGLWPQELSQEGRDALLGLLDNHFGHGRDRPMAFSVSHFAKSFDALFVFLRDNRIRVSEEFLFLGINILTLYLHLEKRGGEYEVAKAFRARSMQPERPHTEPPSA